MPEPTDVVLPILRRIQGDLAETRRELGHKIDSNSDRLDSIEGYLTYELGLTSRSRSDIKTIQTEMKAMKKRLAALERTSKGRSKGR